MQTVLMKSKNENIRNIKDKKKSYTKIIKNIDFNKKNIDKLVKNTEYCKTLYKNEKLNINNKKRLQILRIKRNAFFENSNTFFSNNEQK